VKQFGHVKQLETVFRETFPIYAYEKSFRKNPFKPFHLTKPFHMEERIGTWTHKLILSFED
jgi:hypothetical protein